jgi:hypothetical protein
LAWEAAEMRSRGASDLAVMAVACVAAAGCSISTSSAAPPSPAVASAAGSHTESWTRGILTYWLKWHGTRGGIQIDGFRASFTTCRHVLFFSKCNRGLVRPEITFAIYRPAEVGQTHNRLWGRDVSIGNTFNPLTDGSTARLPRGTRIAATFPPGSTLSVDLWALNDWNGAGEGGGQWYRVSGSGGAVLLG